MLLHYLVQEIFCLYHKEILRHDYYNSSDHFADMLHLLCLNRRTAFRNIFYALNTMKLNNFFIFMVAFWVIMLFGAPSYNTVASYVHKEEAINGKTPRKFILFCKLNFINFILLLLKKKYVISRFVFNLLFSNSN